MNQQCSRTQVLDPKILPFEYCGHERPWLLRQPSLWPVSKWQPGLSCCIMRELARNDHSASHEVFRQHISIVAARIHKHSKATPRGYVRAGSEGLCLPPNPNNAPNFSSSTEMSRLCYSVDIVDKNLRSRCAKQSGSKRSSRARRMSSLRSMLFQNGKSVIQLFDALACGKAQRKDSKFACALSENALPGCGCL